MSATLEPTIIPHYARRDEKGYYTTPDGKFMSVTTILGFMSKGDFLNNWYAKMAALDCVQQSEWFENDVIDLPTFVERIKDWASRMKAAERERDRKGRIGSLAHHALYHSSLGLEFNSNEDLMNWLMYEAKHLQLLTTISQDGEITEGAANDYQRLAIEALPYAVNALAWVAKYEPRWDVVGLEAMGAKVLMEAEGDIPAVGYAGTLDSIAYLQPAKFLDDRSPTGNAMRALHELYPNDQEVRVQIDFKTSNSISDTFAWQVEAYSNFDYILAEDPEGDAVLNGKRMTRFDPGTIQANCILHVKPDNDCNLLAYPRSERIYEGFLSLLDAVNCITDPNRPKPMRSKLPPKEKPAPVRTTVREAGF
jgi:hypothetical protein